MDLGARTIQDAYGDDLAHVHDAGFVQLAEAGATAVVEELQRAGADRGTVVDLGCGSGVSSRILRNAGFDVVGIDLSESMIAMARERVPDAEFLVGSFRDVELPPTVAVLAIGEVFNYTFDVRNDTAERVRMWRRIHAALVPGGLLVFDMAGPSRAPSAGVRRTFAEGDGWAVLSEDSLSAHKELLTRRITTFRRESALYRRACETHRLRLAEPSTVAGELEDAGLVVRRLDRYGPLKLPPGLTGFLGRKPV